MATRPEAVPTGPRRVVPAHVRHCFETGARDWWIWTWNRLNPGGHVRTPYRCNSWRCPGCARHEASVTFSRIREAVDGVKDPTGWVVFVLTLDRRGFYGLDSPHRSVVDALSALAGVPSRWGWQTTDAAFSALSTMTGKFLKRLGRWSVRQGWRSEVGDSRWVGTVEAHVTGWPHVNVLVYAPELARHLRETQPKKPTDHGERCKCRACRAHILVAGELRECVTGAGWGVQSTAEAARDAHSVGAYITKLAGKADDTAGELAKLTQAPTSAPVRFRRLRAGLKFLPPRKKPPAHVTGTLVRRTKDHTGLALALPLHVVAPELLSMCVKACELETQIIEAEQRAATWNRSVGVALPWARIVTPPVTRWGARAPPGLPNRITT